MFSLMYLACSLFSSLSVLTCLRCFVVGEIEKKHLRRRRRRLHLIIDNQGAQKKSLRDQS